MASRVAIANRALTKLGHGRILSLTEDTEAARVVNSCFDVLLAAELRENNWTFSIKRAALPALVSVPEWGYGKEFQLPADYLKLLDVRESWQASLTNYVAGDEAVYQVEGGKILTDLSAPLYIRYVATVDDSATFDALFVEVLACRIAAECAEKLTQSNAKRELAWAEYEKAVNAAHKANAIEVPSVVLADDAWIMSRL